MADKKIYADEVIEGYKAFNKDLLLEHELLLDENARIIAPDNDGNWMMVG